MVSTPAVVWLSREYSEHKKIERKKRLGQHSHQEYMLSKDYNILLGGKQFYNIHNLIIEVGKQKTLGSIKLPK